jgi:hypothetical protein
MSADVLVLSGMVTVKVVVDALFDPKSRTQTAPLAPGL